jgi:hypothetical protein
MAYAKRPSSPPPPVTLELTGEEAQALFDLCGNVGGPISGRRGLIDAIYEALESVGVQPNKVCDFSGVVMFE